MKLVVYLSGQTRTARCHREHDSVAACVPIPKSLEEKFSYELMNCGAVGHQVPAKIGPNENLPTVCPNALSDMVSDLEGETDSPLHPLVADLKLLVHCEAICDHIHIVRGRA